MATTDLLTTLDGPGADADAAESGQWLIDQLRAEQRRADRQRLSALLATHALPRPRAGT